jgi:hypothetical protein
MEWGNEQNRSGEIGELGEIVEIVASAELSQGIILMNAQ